MFPVFKNMPRALLIFNYPCIRESVEWMVSCVVLTVYAHTMKNRNQLYHDFRTQFNTYLRFNSFYNLCLNYGTVEVSGNW